MFVFRIRLVIRAAVLMLFLGARTVSLAQAPDSPAALTVVGMPPEPGEVASQGPAPSWGTSSESVLNVNAWAFDHFGSTAVANSWAKGGRYISAGLAEWIAGFSLPTGALVTGLEVQGCDNSAVSELNVAILRNYIIGGTEQLAIVGTPLHTGIAATPGCGNFFVAMPPQTISNAAQSYMIDVVHTGALDGSVRFQSVRIHYTLQVSPAPSAATFGDVPTGHPFFKFVEALAAAGVTAGCGGGNFCPDTPLTRGQMAVFLSAALGLHWPN